MAKQKLTQASPKFKVQTSIQAKKDSPGQLQKQMSDGTSRVSKPPNFSLGLSNINQKIKQNGQEPLSDRQSSKF